MSRITGVNFRCFFTDGGSNDHYRVLPLEAIPIWIEAYQYTHPEVRSISVKVWGRKEVET